MRTVISATCQQCGGTFATTIYRVADGRGKFCSKACYQESKKLTPEDAWALVDRSGGDDACWEWQGTITRWGYGQFKTNNHLWRAHRLIYTLVHGAIPDGLVVRHGCDNRRCCNPAHLLVGTHDDNMNDMTERGRQASGDRSPSRLHIESRPRGVNHGNAKLSDEAVREIRAARAEGESYVSIARRLGVHKNTIRNVALGKIWRHVE